tara:strand:+ start:2555 stop:3160 length:606 start_codon:yes stop_codon:yes gene_type:complete
MLNNNYKKGLLAIDKYNYSMAIDHFNNAISKNILDEFAYLKRGIAFKCLNENQNAINDFNNVIKLNKNNYEAYFQISETYMSEYLLNPDNKKLLELSLINNNNAIELNKEYYEAFELRSKIHFQMGEYKKAFNLSKSLFDKNPRLSEAYRIMTNSHDLLINEFDKKQSNKDYYISSILTFFIITIVIISSIIFVINYWRWA